MSIIVYLLQAFALVRYAGSSSYRRKTHARWKVTQTHKIVSEVGSGVIGLVVLGEAILGTAVALTR